MLGWTGSSERVTAEAAAGGIGCFCSRCRLSRCISQHRPESAQTGAGSRGADVTLRYEFLRFADMIGAANQALIDEQGIYHSLVGDWIFAAEAHGTRSARSLLSHRNSPATLRPLLLARIAACGADGRASGPRASSMPASRPSSRTRPISSASPPRSSRTAPLSRLARRIKARLPGDGDRVRRRQLPGRDGHGLACDHTISSTRSASTRATAPFRPMSARLARRFGRTGRRHGRARARDRPRRMRTRPR